MYRLNVQVTAYGLIEAWSGHVTH